MKKTAIILTSAAFLTCLSVVSFGQNYKIKQTTSMSGQNMSSTVYVKGSRKRTESSGMMGMGADVATIEQCDLKRTVQVNDKKKLYFIEPFAEESSSESPQALSKPVAQPDRVTKGGTITMTSAINDTGERKQMYGLTARHIKTTMTMQSSPDACNKADMSMETDGWYVDLPQFSCPVSVPRNPMAGQRQPKSGCQDRMVTKTSGGGKLGFPLMSTTTMGGGQGMSFTQSVETLEFSRATLDDALFDVPAGYSLAKSSQELYGRPDMSAMMGGAQNEDVNAGGRNNPNNNMPAAKRPGVKRIGVLVPTNGTGENVSTTNLQSFLVQRLTVGNVEAVAVRSEADARTAGCDLLLTSDISKLKQSTAGKVGGIFGKVTGVPTGSGNYDAQVDFKLVSLTGGQTVLQNKAASKTDSNADRAAEGILGQEAAAILAAIR